MSRRCASAPRGAIAWGRGQFVAAFACLCCITRLSSSSPWPASEQNLSARLHSTDQTRRLAAVQELAELSPTVVRPWVELALADDDSAVRSAAAHLALAYGYVGLSPVVEPWLASRVAQERMLALRLVFLEGTADAIKNVATLLNDTDRQVRALAASTLGASPRAHSELASSLLLSGLDDNEPSVRSAAARALGRLGHVESALPLAAHINDPEGLVRVQIALSLGALGQQTVAPALVSRLFDPEDAVVAAAVRSLSLLKYEPAVFGILALLERSSLDAVTREAIAALGHIATRDALSGLMKKVHDPRAAQQLSAALVGVEAERVPELESCVREAARDTLTDCARLWVDLGGDPSPVLEAVGAGRLSAADALPLLESAHSFNATVLALEAISASKEPDRRAALRYLEVQAELPVQSRSALLLAVREASTPYERASLLYILSKVAGPATESAAKQYWESEDVSVARAAAGLSVAGGLAGESLRQLLTSRRTAWAEGAFHQLSAGMTPNQADTVVDLLVEGRSGRTSQLLDVLWALPSELSPSTERALLGLLTTTNGQDRDALFDGLVHVRGVKELSRYLSRGDAADRLKLIQLAALHPAGKRWAEILVDDPHPRVAALAMQQLGALGSGQLVHSAFERVERRTTVPQYLRAAALRSLSIAVERGVVTELPTAALSQETCRSEHLGVKLEALRLAVAAGKPCADVSMIDLLHHDQDARMRLALAQLLSAKSESDPEVLAALIRCSIYESRQEIADACAARSPQRMPVGPDGGSSVPLQRYRVHPTWLPRETPSYPVMLRVEQRTSAHPGSWFLGVSDRRGLILLPKGEVTIMDAALAF